MLSYVDQERWMGVTAQQALKEREGRGYLGCDRSHLDPDFFLSKNQCIKVPQISDITPFSSQPRFASST